MAFDSAAPINRRTVAKGIAWSVPAVAIASTAPAFATSHDEPDPPVFDFANGWKNPGNSCTSRCIPKQSYSAKVTLINDQPENYILQFTSYAIGESTDTTGVFGITGSQDCDPIAPVPCTDTCAGFTTNSVCVPAGTAAMTVYVTSNNHGSSPNGGQWIGWRWVRASDCTVVSSGTATSPDSPPGC